MIASLVIMSILLVAMGGALALSSQAVPDEDNRTTRIVDASAVIDQIASELTYAITFSELTETAVTFTVADRDADSVVETIRYAWSGTAGDPLTRQCNGGAIVEIVQDVQEFELDCITRTETTTETQTGSTVSDEILLASFDGWLGVETPTEVHERVGLDFWVAEYFTVTGVPAEATKLVISRAFFKMRQGTLGSAGTFSVGVHAPATPGEEEPAADPIGTPVVLSGSALGASTVWTEITFSDVEIESPGSEYVIVVSGTDSLLRDVEVLKYYDNKAPDDDGVGLWTLDAGATWYPSSKRNQNDFPFEVYGTYESTESQEVEVSRELLAIIAVKLEVGSDDEVCLQTAARILNEPEVTP
jgi:hypothetical protein